MSLYLVRHAKAGERSAWTGPDEERPLSTAGWKQARKLGKRLAEASSTTATPKTLVSSPFVRCMQTLEPLGERLGLEVVPDLRLSEGACFEDTLDLLDELPDGSVLCSHGDVIPDTVSALVRRGLEVRSQPDWRKASVWVIDRNAAGRYTRATVWPPPGKS
jgi:phosphohistidine phosphatase SixA